jgi:hypothetical protein
VLRATVRHSGKDPAPYLTRASLTRAPVKDAASTGRHPESSLIFTTPAWPLAAPPAGAQTRRSPRKGGTPGARRRRWYRCPPRGCETRAADAQARRSPRSDAAASRPRPISRHTTSVSSLSRSSSSARSSAAAPSADPSVPRAWRCWPRMAAVRRAARQTTRCTVDRQPHSCRCSRRSSGRCPRRRCSNQLGSR